MPNIAIIWDFDGTLTPDCSTTKTVEFLNGIGAGKEFWETIKTLKGEKGISQKKGWEHILGTDAPLWMYSLARHAFTKGAPLNDEFFKHFIVPQIKLYDNTLAMLKRIKDLSSSPDFAKCKLEVHHFVVSAGLKDLIRACFPEDLIKWVFGCKYKVIATTNGPESVPVYCMDETMKTRALFEISKGCFFKDASDVNKRVPHEKLWAPFENMIYIGDSDTDVPSFSLVRERGGLGIMVHDPKKDKAAVIKKMRTDKRVDLITETNFSGSSELYKFIEIRCQQIRQRYEAYLV
jgi:hypothetical protein